jgi:hypothetical protein
MIILTKHPYSIEQLEFLKEQFDVYVKTVIDINRKVCVSGMDRHFEGEELLLKDGSMQSDLWGGGIDLESKVIDYNSFINIRPNDNNTSNEIQSEEKRRVYGDLTKHFFKVVYDK